MYVLEGTAPLLRQNCLLPGDGLVFAKSKDGELLVAGRRAQAKASAAAGCHR
jgi:hypothetical protein